MTALAAAVAAACAVLAAWEALTVLDGPQVLAAIGRAIAPARAAGSEGRDPPAAERRRLALVAVAVAAAGGALIAGPALGGLAAVSAPAAAGVLVRVRRRRWQRRLDRCAPSALGALADVLAAGNGLPGAIAIAARDGALEPPARMALAEVAAAIALGAPVADALGGLRERAGPGTWNDAGAAMLVQREAGGDLVALLRGLADGAELAARDAAEARAASTQARLTARIVLGLPALACALLVLASPRTAGAMVREPLPLTLLVVAGVLQAAAIAAVRHIAGSRGR